MGKRNLPSQYHRLVGLVDLANFIHKFPQLPGRVRHMFYAGRGQMLETAPFYEAPSTPADLEPRVWRAAAKWFGWPRKDVAEGRATYAGIRFTRHKDDSFGYDLVETASLVDATLRYLVACLTEGLSSGPTFELPNPSPRPTRAFGVGGDGRLVYLRDHMEAVIVPALESDPKKKRGFVDINRLRICPVCNRLHIVGRLDATACSPPCLNVEKKRRYNRRKKYKSENKARNAKLAAGQAKWRETDNGQTV